jgi:hypothetical protein
MLGSVALWGENLFRGSMLMHSRYPKIDPGPGLNEKTCWKAGLGKRRNPFSPLEWVKARNE